MSTRKAPAQYGLATDQGLPPLVEAVSIALAVLRAAKAARWSDLLTETDDGTVLTMPYEVVLTSAQQGLLEEYQHLLLAVQRSTPAIKGEAEQIIDPGTRLITYAVCPICQRWQLLSGGSAPARCVMSFDCPGSPMKASVASKDVNPEADPLTEAIEAADFETEIAPETSAETEEPEGASDLEPGEAELIPGNSLEKTVGSSAPTGLEPSESPTETVEPSMPAAGAGPVYDEDGFEIVAETPELV